MKNTIGPPVTGDEFFGRERELKKMYEIMQNKNSSILIPGPRRIGKTSLVKEFMIRNENEFNYIFLDLMDTFSIIDFCNDLLKKVKLKRSLITIAGNNCRELWNAAVTMIGDVDTKIFKIKPGMLNPNINKIMDKLECLFEILSDNNCILILDEFSDFILNLKENNENYKLFLKWFRKLRQSGKMRVIITGSINLQTTAEELCFPHLINDPVNVEIIPLTKKETLLLIETLLNTNNINISKEVQEFIYEKVEDGVPFYIKMFVDGIFQYTESGKFINKIEEIENIYERITDKRYTEFVDFHNRLGRYFEQHNAAKIIHSNLACDEMEFEDLYSYLQQYISSKSEANKVLRRLIDECYIKCEKKKYSFVSPMLKDWWKKIYGFERSN